MGQALPARGQRMLSVIPLVFLVYTVVFMDRASYGAALPAMSRDLHFNRTIAVAVLGAFFAGRLIISIPAGHLAERRSAKWLIFTLLLFWALFAIPAGLVQNLPELLAARFLLGLVEGGLMPATLVLFGNWFPQDERARATNLWLLNLPFAAVVVSPIAGAILASTHYNWRLLFVVGAIPPLVWATIWALVIRDRPRDARWLSRDAKEKVEEQLRAERELSDRPDLSSYRRAFTSGTTWLFAAIAFFGIMPSYGFITFLPSLLRSHGLGTGTVGLLTALPFAAGVIGLLIAGVLSDRNRSRRFWIVVPYLVVGVGLLVSLLTEGSPIWTIALFTVAGLGLYAHLGPYWASVAQVIPAGVVGGSIGMINALANLGGFVGPLAVALLATRTGGYQSGFAFLGVCALIMAGLAMLIRVREGEAAKAAATPGNS